MGFYGIKIFIFGRVMAKNGAHVLFWANWAENFYGRSGEYYLSIGHWRRELRNPSYDAYFLFSGHFWWENGRGHHARP